MIRLNIKFVTTELHWLEVISEDAQSNQELVLSRCLVHIIPVKDQLKAVYSGLLYPAQNTFKKELGRARQNSLAPV